MIPFHLLEHTQHLALSALPTDRPLRIKLGVDPTRPDLTLGHAVVLKKLRQFQDAGHQAILIIGDFTTRLGDPTGRSAARPMLTEDEIKHNATTYLDQAGKILDLSKLIIHWNSEWFSKMSFYDCLKLTSTYTVSQLLSREDFSARLAQQKPLAVSELVYPLLQGYDSTQVMADIEIGGHDQLLNILVGRALMSSQGLPPQAVITMPLLPGTDGIKKMSKSSNNYIALTAPPRELYSKLMSIPDHAIKDYLTLLLGWSSADIPTLEDRNPYDLKKELAFSLTSQLHTPEAAEDAHQEFTRIAKGEVRTNVPNFRFSDLDTTSLVSQLASTGLFPSKKEIKRLLDSGAIRINSHPASLTTPRITLPVQVTVGKRLAFNLIH